MCPPYTIQKGPSVKRSLSVLLPVKDVQATLSDSVHEILDVAADCGERFEVLIIDDGSTDATSEVAHELSRHYPQVRMLSPRRAAWAERRPSAPACAGAVGKGWC